MYIRVCTHIHTHPLTCQADPLVLICTDLGKELGVKGEQILLSHRMSTLDPASSPATLSLSTADILGELCRTYVYIAHCQQLSGITDGVWECKADSA